MLDVASLKITEKETNRINLCTFWLHETILLSSYHFLSSKYWKHSLTVSYLSGKPSGKHGYVVMFQMMFKEN